MKWILLLFLILINACTISDEELSSAESIDFIIENGVKNFSEKTSNFNVLERPYFKIEKNSNKNKLLSMPVNIYSVSNLSVLDSLNLIENQLNIPTYLSDYYALSEEEVTSLSDTKKIMFKGTLEGFLQYLTKVFGVHMSLDENAHVKASFYQTKTFTIDQFINGNTASATMSIGGGEGTAGGLSGTTGTTVESDTWTKIQEYVDSVIGENGKATILEDFSVVRITARPWVINEIQGFFARLKEESQMQVAVQYRIITINRTKLNYYAAAFQLDVLRDNFGLTSELISAIATPQASGGMNIASASINARLDAIVQSLANEVISEGQFVGMPNRIIPINLTQTQAYIAEVQSSDNQDINEQTLTVKTGELKTGLSMLMLPKVMEDGRIQLTSGFTQKKLVSLESLSNVQLPTVDETETLSTVTVDPGGIELIALYSGSATSKENALQFFSGGMNRSTDDKIIAVIVGADTYKLASTVAKRGN